MFEQHYELICKDFPSFGRIALVPWDIETFGFGVADYQTGDPDTEAHDSSRLMEHLKGWAESHQVELVGTTVPASNIARLLSLQSLGFRYIDTTLVVRYDRIQESQYPHTKVTLRLADRDELEPVVQICGEAFKNGRYHADKRVPVHLANKRYQEWASRTFDEENPQTLLVAKIMGQVCAFSIIEFDRKQGYLHLNAVAPRWQGQKIGIGLLASTMRYFQKNGVELVRSKISAANTHAMNLHASLGARFYDPQILLHWHAPWATHLLTVEK